jgi:hypothetical protein
MSGKSMYLLFSRKMPISIWCCKLLGMIILFDSGQITCESFKSNGFEEGGEEEMVEVADDGEELSLLLEPLFFGSVELLPFISTTEIFVDDAELFNGDFMLDEDDEDFSSVAGFAGTKSEKFNSNYEIQMK